ncbi:hypothetical protein ARMGADRAFT_1082279 [Armillaria gallica]|uniref:Uncharacterized protein n=1 Tax=Armillaria gallica TaxID=47427 RepID=A0A2H3DAB3_ARMGA|nr:hypothetical protein ARMGADRAFT_1082279 [Armillaria gallica]
MTMTPIPIATYPASPTSTWGPITAVRWCRYNWGLYIDYHLSMASPLHSIPTPTAWPPPPFAALGNPMVKSFFAYDLAITIKTTSSPPHPSPPSQRCLEHHDYPITVCLDALSDDAYYRIALCNCM